VCACVHASSGRVYHDTAPLTSARSRSFPDSRKTHGHSYTEPLPTPRPTPPPAPGAQLLGLPHGDRTGAALSLFFSIFSLSYTQAFSLTLSYKYILAPNQPTQLLCPPTQHTQSLRSALTQSARSSLSPGRLSRVSLSISLLFSLSLSLSLFLSLSLSFSLTHNFSLSLTQLVDQSNHAHAHQVCSVQGQAGPLKQRLALLQVHARVYPVRTHVCLSVRAKG
jgi:hypothetical protein